MQALRESHELLEKQVILCNKTSSKAADLEAKLREMTTQLDMLKHKYDEKALELEVEKAVAVKDAEDWKEQVCETSFLSPADK